MPNRIIREAILDSDRYRALKNDSERLFFYEILLLADDYGLCPANYSFLESKTLPCMGKTKKQVNGFLSCLQDDDLIRLYEIEGKRYLFIPRFGNIPKRGKPKCPLPPDSVMHGRDCHSPAPQSL